MASSWEPCKLMHSPDVAMLTVWLQLQSLVRMWRDRKRYRDRKKFFKDNVSSSAQCTSGSRWKNRSLSDFVLFCFICFCLFLSFSCIMNHKRRGFFVCFLFGVGGVVCLFLSGFFAMCVVIWFVPTTCHVAVSICDK